MIYHVHKCLGEPGSYFKPSLFPTSSRNGYKMWQSASKVLKTLPRPTILEILRLTQSYPMSIQLPHQSLSASAPAPTTMSRFNYCWFVCFFLSNQFLYLLVSCCEFSFLAWMFGDITWKFGTFDPFGAAWHFSNPFHFLSLVLESMKSKSSMRAHIYRHHKVRYCVHLTFLFLPHCLTHNRYTTNIFQWIINYRSITC